MNLVCVVCLLFVCFISTDRVPSLISSRSGGRAGVAGFEQRVRPPDGAGAVAGRFVAVGRRRQSADRLGAGDAGAARRGQRRRRRRPGPAQSGARRRLAVDHAAARSHPGRFPRPSFFSRH